MSKELPKIIIITGATAVGKSAVAVLVAKQFNGEIISADSMQIFKRFNIGTGKLTKDEMQGISHHLIDIKEPDEEYSVSEFINDAKKSIKEIIARDKLPILVGGTGLYINSLINGYNFANSQKSIEIREKIEAELLEKGNQFLYEKLKALDSISAEKISINDTKRIIRALEIYESSGQTKADAIRLSNPEYNYLTIVLDEERSVLYERINKRVDSMINNGLKSEVEGLLEFKGCQSMQAIGYKELVEYFDNKTSFELAVDKVKKNSRNYAKRQLTYFRWMKMEKIWLNCNNFDEIMEKIYDFK